jgi:hypothetical protein
VSVGVAHLSQLGFVFHPTNDLGVVGKIYYIYLQLWSPHSLFKIPSFPTTRGSTIVKVALMQKYVKLQLPHADVVQQRVKRKGMMWKHRIIDGNSLHF